MGEEELLGRLLLYQQHGSRCRIKKCLEWFYEVGNFSTQFLEAQHGLAEWKNESISGGDNSIT